MAHNGTEATESDAKERATTENRIDRYRQGLLDLTNRNRLLNFKHGERSRRYVRVVDELPAFLFEKLLSARSFRFKPIEPRRASDDGAPLSVEDAARQQAVEPSLDLPVRTRDTPPAHHTDTFIQVLHFPDRMTRQLETMRQDHLTSIQELGVPSLYAVFGFLEWFEKPDAPSPLLSPLLLVPLDIERRRERGEYVYHVSSGASEPEPNRTLAFRLKGEHGVNLPAWDPLDEEPDVDRYLEAVATAIEGLPRWRVRRFVTVTTLSFARQVLYEDLAPERWVSTGGRSESPILRALLAAGEAPPFVPKQGTDPVLVTDADSTQLAAITDALEGRNMVVKGPPGTGKSQTITNLIAASLAQGKTVLFVAEKMAALEVVKKRIDDAGLGPFCLSLHSTRAHKRDVLKALEKSIQARADAKPEPAGAPVPDATPEREAVEKYRAAMAGPAGALECTVQEALWREHALRRIVAPRNPELLPVRIANAAAISPSELLDARRRATDLEESVAALGRANHEDPWSFVTTWSPPKSDVEAISAAIGRWSALLRAMREQLATLGSTNDSTLDAIADLGGQLVDLSHVGAEVPAHLLTALVSADVADAVAELASALETRRSLAAEVERVMPLDRGRPVAPALLRLAQLVDGRLVDPGLDFAALPGVLRARRAEIEALREGSKALHEVWEALGAPGTWGAKTQRVLVVAARLVSEGGRDVLRSRTEGCLQSDCSQLLKRARESARALSTKSTSIDEELTGWAELGADRLRELATVLRSTGFFGRIFGSEYRAAVRAYLGLSTGREADREVMAQRLHEAAKHLDDVRAWSTPELTTACGRHFQGLATDFGLLQKVSDWGFRVRAMVTGADVTSRWVRAFLFEANEDALAPLLELWEQHGQALLSAMSDGIELSEVVRRRSGLLDDATQILAEADGVAVQPGASIEQVADAARRLLELGVVDARIATSAAKPFIGPLWRASETDPSVLRAACSASQTLRDIAFPAFVSEWLLTPSFGERRASAIATGRALLDLCSRERIARQESRLLGVSLADLPSSLEPLLGRLDRATRAGGAALALRGRFLSARAEARQHAGLDTVCTAIERANGAWTGLGEAFEWCVLRTVCAELSSRDPDLVAERWTGTRLSHHRARARDLEHSAIRARREQLAGDLAARPIAPGQRVGARREWTDKALIEHEISKKRAHIPIRELMSRGRNAIVSLAPCLMMSPLAIAQFLGDPTFRFDLLIVDEASQLRPEDALGALLRARQVVVVGDEQQLPPTAFFTRSDPDEGEDDDDDDLEAESLLDLARTAFGAPRELRWHYRSRHESLIAFCNRSFYDGSLVVAPSPSASGPGLGVEVLTVDGCYEKSTNPAEAEHVVAKVFDLMREHPKLSIGVVAMNQQQAALIREILDRKVTDAAASYIETWKDRLEPFFVKNLENVQGDERDIIVISTTYGPDREGTVHQRFGPILGMHGHRRLNVLFSRAKCHTLVVTSLKPQDIRVKADSSRGLATLHGYLSEHSAPPKPPPEGPSSAGFASLGEALRDLGFDVVAPVGTPPVAFDLAVVHPDSRSSFVAGIEVDGAALHRAQDPRDRDVVRPLVLSQRDWTVLSEWTSDWHREPAASSIRLRDKLHEACHRANLPIPAPRAIVTPKVVEGDRLLALAPPPMLVVEVRAEAKVLSTTEVCGGRIRVGRSQHCDVRIPDAYEEVAPRHFELTWDGTRFAIAALETRAGVYLDGARIGSGATPLVEGRTHTVRCGLGRVNVRLAYGSELDATTAPATAPTQVNLDPGSVPVGGPLESLSVDERKFLTLLRENHLVKGSQLATVLGRAPVRVNGLVRNLRRRLVEAGMPPFFEDSYGQDGDVVFRRTGSVP